LPCSGIIKELFEQEQRVKRDRFSENLKRTKEEANPEEEFEGQSSLHPVRQKPQIKY